MHSRSLGRRNVCGERLDQPDRFDEEALAGRISLQTDWLSAHAAHVLCETLSVQTPWSIHRIRLFGRWVDSPRLSCWIGDPQAVYRYSGQTFAPHPWTQGLAALRDRLREELGVPFNSVLANLYRDGRDAMGWHSDDEPELGAEPVIASLSLGAARRFVLRRRDDHAVKQTLVLAPGSLLVMRGPCQREWQHALPRTAKPVGPRLNLTFRHIQPLRR
ncbi:alpha-ketoglutarate-dependent dioxygenase AlkB [Pseudoxanthomonas winnipegensis]|nr:alpha-ketoglutarate-dependent dioxygenase AlkB [Pseudoxanthomonas winnipegensis]